MSRKPLIAGNWKMNGSRADARRLAETLVQRWQQHAANSFDMAVFPPFTALDTVAPVLAGTPIGLGGQDCSAHASGAYTGDVSAAMLEEAGCTYVLVGHSERRQYQHEIDSTIGRKAAAAQVAGLLPVLCIGETLEQRQNDNVFDVLSAQLEIGVPEGTIPQTLVVAYEPVWAIGTGEVATPGQIAQAHAFIRQQLKAQHFSLEEVRILYGGSVKAENAAEILAIDDVDGALVGGASLQAESFWAIASAAA